MSQAMHLCNINSIIIPLYFIQQVTFKDMLSQGGKYSIHLLLKDFNEEENDFMRKFAGKSSSAKGFAAMFNPASETTPLSLD